MWDINGIIEKIIDVSFASILYPIRKIIALPGYVKNIFYSVVLILVIGLIYWIYKNRDAYLYVRA